MWRFWQTFTRPICEAVQPKDIVEVGSLGGLNSENLIAFCRETGANFHVVDPEPIDPAEIQKLLGDTGKFYQDISLNVLPKLTGDLILLDGDHNWYTVIHELRAIAQCAKDNDRKFPVVLLHDVCWPYGRRDLYYVPERIPSEYRHPYAQRGLEVDQSDLVENGGYNLRHYNAFVEGGPRNGVLTAVEEFVEEGGDKYRLYRIPGFHGLGVLYAPGDLSDETNRKLEALCDLPEHVTAYLDRLEEDRLRLLVHAYETHWSFGGKPGPRTAFMLRLARRIKSMGKDNRGP